jgi:integrase
MLARLSEITGIEFAAHDLRRTFATHWMRHCKAHDGLAETLLEMQLGHSARTITREHYVVLNTDDLLKHYVSPLDDVFVPGLG